MSEWATPKRFWKTTAVEAHDDGYTVVLDDRPLRTPQKSPLIMPSAALAESVAREWDEQGERVDPQTLPFTRLCNSAIDKVTVQFADVADAVAAFGGSDLLCYRADGPSGLVARQAAAWDDILDWAAEYYGARLVTTQGIMPVAQDSAVLLRLSEIVHQQTPFSLTALYELVNLSGSLILGLAVGESRLPADVAWESSKVDEDWQIEAWGQDDEAAEVRELKKQDFLRAAAMISWL